MRQFYPLDKVIKKVPEPVKNLSSGQKLVSIDTKTGKALQNKSFLGIGNWLKDAEYYLVSTGTQADDKFIYNDKVFGAGSFSLVIEYQVSCEIENADENAEKVAEALCLDTHPGAKLEQKIEQYVKDFIRKNRYEFLNNFPQEIEKLKQLIIDKVKTEIFLTIDVQISLDQSKLNPFFIESQHFPVLVKDCNEELDLELRAELIVDPKNKIKAISNYDKRSCLSDLVKEEIKHHLLSNVSLQEFYYELKTSVYQKLKRHLDSILAEQGLQIRFLSIDTNSSFPEEFFEIEHDVKYQLQDYSEEITIKNRLQLKSYNISYYKIAGSPSLISWSQKQLSLIIRQVLFQKKYTDILYAFAAIANDIRTKIENEAEKIGYQVDHIISVAELKETLLTREFSLEEEEGTFATKDAKVKVKLNTIIKVKIEKLELIQEYLNKKVDVEEFKGYMKAAIHDIISDFLHTVEPERYYLRFDTKDESYPEEEKTVAEELKSRIGDELSQKFHATVISVVIKYLDTEVSKRYEKLSKGSCPFEIEVESWQVRYKQDEGEKITFKGDLQVVGVDRGSWSIFQTREASLEEIKQYFLRSLKPKLKTFTTSSLAITDADELKEMQDFVNNCANQALTEQYGLIVNVRNWDRERTKSEIAQANLAEQKRNVRLKAEETKIIEISTHLDDKKADIEQKTVLKGLKNQAQVNRYVQLQKELDEVQILDEDALKEGLENLENKAPTLETEDIDKMLDTLAPEQPKRLKFNQALQNSKVLSSSDSNDSQSNDSSNSEE